MLHILLVTKRPEDFRSFAECLSSDPELFLEHVDSRAETLSIVRTKCPHLVIVDSRPPEIGAMDLVREVIRANAMVNTAVISPLPESDFHTQSEGLGVLCRLPVEAGKEEVSDLLQKLRSVTGAG